jgi:hypothetical protein
MPILVNVDGLTPEGNGAVLRWSTGGGFLSGPTDAPANTVWEPRIIQAGNYERHLFTPGATFGSASIGQGEIVINDADGALDGLLDWALDGRRVEIRRGPRRGRYPEDFPLVQVGTLEGLESQGRNRWLLRLRDRRAEIADVLLNPETFAGTNSGPTGLEATESAGGGTNKPRPYGVVRNATLPWANTSLVVAQAAAAAPRPVSVTAVYDRGVSPVSGAGAPYSSLSDLTQTSAPAPGTWRVYPGSATEGTYVRDYTTPGGELTADLIEGASAADRYAARLAARILSEAGVATADILGAAELDAVTPWSAGWWTGTSPARAGDALDRLTASIHGAWLPDRQGRFQIVRLAAPAPPAALIIEPWMILKGDGALSRTVNALEGLPVWRVTVRYQRNWTPQDANTVLPAALDRKAWAALDYRTIVLSDEAVKRRHPLAREIVLDTALDAPDDARSLAEFLLQTYCVRRDLYTVDLPSDQALGADLGVSVELRVPRFDLRAGKLFRAIGLVEDLTRNRTTLTLWG